MKRIKIYKEFKEFAVKGNVVDMGVGIVLGAAFTTIINSFVKDLLSPVLSLLTLKFDLNDWFVVLKEGTEGGIYQSLAEAELDSAITLNIGVFSEKVISFLIVAFFLFLLIRAINKLKRPVKVTDDPVKSKECPYCFSNISLKAVKCPHCTSVLNEKVRLE